MSNSDERSLLESSNQVAPEAQGVSFNNIPPSTSNHARDLSSGGEDTAKLSLWVSFDLKRFEELTKQLDALKMKAQEDGEGAYLPMGFDQWEVHKSGFHLGKSGKRGPYFRWQLRFNGIRIGLASRPFAHRCNGACNMWLEIGSEILMVSGGLRPVYAQCVTMIESLGGKINDNTLSEVHVCVDMPEVDVGDFQEQFKARRFVSRGKLSSTHDTSEGVDAGEHAFGLKPTGFEFGGSIRLCVYEKRWESRNSPSKLAILERCRWGGPVDQAVRVEFKIRRNALKGMGVQLNPWTLTRQAIGCLTQALSLCGFQVREQEDFLEGARLLLKRYADVK
jgi:hypothetical protein